MEIEKLLPGIKKNISLREYTTFKIGGKSRYFFLAETKEELVNAVRAAKKMKLGFFILGAGSNLLVADKGFKGLIIKIKNDKHEIRNNKILAGAGSNLGQLIAASAKNSLGGLEWASGIPGTVGGSIRGNAGAFGSSMADAVESVEVLDSKNLKFKIYKSKDCRFGYRQSIFKKKKNLIIFSATFKLQKEEKEKISKKIKEYLDYRKERHPKDPSAGSVFKNLKFESFGSKLILKNFPELLQFKEKGSIPAAFLISQCGLQGKRIGDVKVSEQHANFILNTGRGKARDVVKLIKLIKNEVKNKFGVILEEEIEMI
ncbi:MAG: UDP-N-acetylmuramate dehydrogenase [bacterium]|nr:UDP-N-acetylmuramate dehydrogenase [bacterium]